VKPERWLQIKDVLHVALQVSNEERPGFLDQACAGDESLWEEIDARARVIVATDTWLCSPDPEVR